MVGGIRSKGAPGGLMTLLVLVAATLFCGIVVSWGPKAAEALLPLLGETGETDYPRIETLYSGVIFGQLLLFALIGSAITRRNPLRLGREPLRIGALGAALGMFGVAMATFYTWIAHALTPMIATPPGFGLFLWGSAVILFQSATEEIYFRGWLQPVLASRWGLWPGIILTTIVFALLHLLGGAQSLFAVVNLALGGLLFGLLAARSGGIAGAVMAHFGWNWIEQMVFGLFPNPGTGSFSALLDLDLTGPGRWGGSAEGLNASAAMTFALVAMLVPLLILWTRGRRGLAATPAPASA